MKESSLTYWHTPNTGATNSSGFTALPGGYRDYGGDFVSLADYAVFWSSSQGGATSAWYRGLVYDLEYVGRSYSYRTYGNSGRCVQD